MADKDTYLPTNGESPLGQDYYDTLHKTPTTGGSDAAAQQWAFLDFQQQFGRNPTQSELNMLSPQYGIGDTNKLDLSRGKAAVSTYYQTKSGANSPDDVYKQQQEKYLKDAPQHFDTVNSLFKSTLGRDATQDELNHFGSELASGTTDQYQLGQFLQQQPEYTTKQDEEKQAKIKADNQSFLTGRQEQDKAFQQQLSGQLSDYDKQYFNEQILPSIQQSFAKQGRSFDSSGFQNSATQSAQQQNLQRDQYLAGITASQYNDYQQLAAAQNADVQQLSTLQYGSRQNQAYQDYANQVAQQQSLINSGTANRFSGVQGILSSNANLSDYRTQQDAYNQYLAKYGKRNPGAGVASGALAGAGTGAYIGSAVPGIGTAIGAGVGAIAGGLGGYFGSY